MTLLTRQELCTKLDVSNSIVKWWSQGWYMRLGKKTYFFPDHHKVKAVKGLGIKSNPFLYDLDEVNAYRLECKRKEKKRKEKVHKKIQKNKLEIHLCKKIILDLNTSGTYYCWRVNSGAIKSKTNGKTRLIHMAKAGTSDIQGIVKSTGRMFCLEVKRPETRNTVTELQQQYLDKMKEFGAVVGVVTSPEEALDILENKKPQQENL